MISVTSALYVNFQLYEIHHEDLINWFYLSMYFISPSDAWELKLLLYNYSVTKWQSSMNVLEQEKKLHMYL